MVTPCASADLSGLDLRIEMPNGVGYEGTVELAKGRIEGALLYTDGSQREAVLQWAPRADYPTLFPRAGSQSSYSYSPPQADDDGMAVGAAADYGVDPAALETAVHSVIRGDAGILKSLLVLKGGTLILEEYFHEYGPNDLFPIQSCTKSVSSLLTGLAIQEGHIPDTDALLLDFFPEARSMAGEGWEALTLEHLLTMSLALDWSPEESQGLHGTGPAAFRQILERNVVGQPGEDWEYVNMNVNLLAGVLHAATGEFPEAFAERTLFGPLGIERWDWNYSKTEGFNLMDGSLRLRPRDMAKIGVMMAAGGKWAGSQVVEEDWVKRSLEAHLPTGAEGEEYGYLWWRMALPGPGGDLVRVVFANGWGSQFILIFPDLDMVVVTTGGNMENGRHLALGNVLVRDLLPGVTPSGE
jgi:CubicO group peptidase (beta-lactamase class C family)